MPRKRKGTPVDPAFALFQQGAPAWREPEEPDQNKGQQANQNQNGNSSDAAIRALEGQIALLRDAQRANARTSTALLAQHQSADPEPTIIREMNLENLPDPVNDPKGYAQAIAQRGQQMLMSQQQHDAWVARQVNARNDALSGVWDRFSNEHSEYAAHSKLVQAAMTNVINAAKSRNIDTNKLVLNDTDNFFSDVMQEMRDMAGGAADTLFTKDTDENEDGDEPDDNTDTNVGNAALEDDNADEGRTAGVFGGADTGNRPAPQNKADESVDMFDGLKQWQQKNGWHL